MTNRLRWYLRILAGFTLVACLGHLLLTTRVGAASAWGSAPGWQREIAFFDLATYIVIARTIRVNDPAAARTVAIALVVLQLLAATNHAAAAIQDHSLLNVILAPLNYACLAFGLWALRAPTRGRDLASQPA